MAGILAHDQEYGQGGEWFEFHTTLHLLADGRLQNAYIIPVRSHENESYLFDGDHIEQRVRYRYNPLVPQYA